MRTMITDFTIAQNGATALISAAEKGHTDCVRQLLQSGADKNAADQVRYC
jgi:ankyrin repeat protein